MGALRNPRHERFALELAEMKKPVDAYRIAGFTVSPGSGAANARKLARNPAVKKRVQELVARAIEYSDVTRIKTVVQIDRVARANLVDFFDVVFDDKKQPKLRLKDLSKLPRAMTDAVKSLKIKDDGAIELELHDKNQANFTLLKYLGGIPDDKPAQQVNIFASMSLDDQLALAGALERSVTGAAPKQLDLIAEEVGSASPNG